MRTSIAVHLPINEDVSELRSFLFFCFIGRFDLQVSEARHFWREKSVYLLVWQRLIDGKMRLEYNYGATIQ